MSFGNKDLMTKVLPHGVIDAAQIAKFCALRTYICRWPTFCAVSCPRFFSFCGGCSILVTDITVGCRFTNSCGAGGSACDPTQYCIGSDPFVIQDLEDLVTIRAELAQTLKQLDGMEKEFVTGITTKAEADALEASLKSQLDHLQKVRGGLK
jgi:hypothetical protein